MNRYRIEHRDLELVNRFRYKVEEKAARRKRLRRKLTGAGLVVCMAAALSLYVFFSPDGDKTIANRSAPVALIQAPRQLQGQSADQVKIENVAPQVATDGALEETPAPSPAPSATASAVFPTADAIDYNPPIKKAVFEKPEIKTPAVLAEKKSASSLPRPIVEKSIRINRIVSCREVKNRKSTGSQTTFSVEKNARLWVWMEVQSKTLPRTLRHVYFMNGRRFCEVPLSIDYSRTRTWSNISLSLADVGKWRVDVINETGEVLSRVQFDVIP